MVCHWLKRRYAAHDCVWQTFGTCGYLPHYVTDALVHILAICLFPTVRKCNANQINHQCSVYVYCVAMIHLWCPYRTHVVCHFLSASLSHTTCVIRWGKSCQKHNHKYMAKWCCLLAMEKLHVSAYSGCYRPKHVVFSIDNKSHRLVIYL